MQLWFRIRVHDIKCRKRLALVHPHIQCSRVPGRETPVCCIQLMAADAEIGDYTIHSGDMMQAQEPLQVTKIMLNKDDPFIIRQIFSGIIILIKGYQLSCCT